MLTYPTVSSEDDTDGSDFLVALALFVLVLLGDSEELSLTEDDCESTVVELSSRRSLVFPANSFIEPILAAAALLFRVGGFAGDFGEETSGVDSSFFTTDFLLLLFAVTLSFGVFTGDTIVTFRLVALGFGVLTGEEIGDSV